MYQGQRDFEKAAIHFREAIKINPRYASAYNNLGVMFRNQRRLDEAQKPLELAIAINPQFAEAHYNLGSVYALQKKPDLARTKFRDCLRQDPDYGPAHHQIAIQLQADGKHREAVAGLKRAVSSRATSIDATRRLAWILATCPDDSVRDGQLAMKLVQRAGRSVKSPNVALLRTLAAAHAEVREFPDAVRWQQRAIGLCKDGAIRSQLDADLAKLQRGVPIRSNRE